MRVMLSPLAAEPPGIRRVAALPGAGGAAGAYGEGEGRVYESDEDPLDLYSPVEGKIEIKLR